MKKNFFYLLCFFSIIGTSHAVENSTSDDTAIEMIVIDENSDDAVPRNLNVCCQSTEPNLQGPRGRRGERGPRGLPAPTLTYAYANNTDATESITNGQNIAFDNSFVASGITLSSDKTTFTITKDGVYLITWYANFTTTNSTLALLINSNTIFGNGMTSSTTENMGSIALSLVAGYTVQIGNTTGSTLTLTNHGSTGQNMAAYISIQQLS